jgi:hypothetical protein
MVILLPFLPVYGNRKEIQPPTKVPPPEDIAD